jgi:YidC/Oxa1 family membrane protein insertase
MSNPSPKISSDIVIGGLCFVLAVAWFGYSSYRWPAPRHVAAPAAQVAAPLPASALAPAKAQAQVQATPSAPEQTAVLENANFRVVFTSHGGGIARIEMKQHAIEKGTVPVVLNAGPHDAPELPIFDLGGWEEGPFASYEQAADAGHVTYTRVLADGVRVERTYTLSGAYGVTLVQTVANPGKAAVTLPAYRLQIGSVAPLYVNDTAATLAANWETGDGKSFGHIGATDFPASKGFLGFNARAARAQIASPAQPMRWAAVKNRFFTLVLTPPADQPILGVVAQPAGFGRLGGLGIVNNGTGRAASLDMGIGAAVLFPPLTLDAGQSRAETFSLYAGPKEHGALAALGQGQERLMDYNWFGWLAVPLAAVMEWMHQYIPNYGWVIVLLTLALKLILWPLQSASNHSMKKMQALAPKAKELQEKHKEDPQRLQVETMKLYRDYGVNPVGGCLPMLVTIPVFLGFYTMLQNSGQLQHQSWLWVRDLVQPDTVGYLPFFHIAINPLPIISACSQYGLMKLTPQAGSNPQMKILQWMPFLMLVMLYQFAAALSLYWTVNNLVSMVQSYRNMRKPVPALQKVKRKPLPALGAAKPRRK